MNVLSFDPSSLPPGSPPPPQATVSGTPPVSAKRVEQVGFSALESMSVASHSPVNPLSTQITRINPNLDLKDQFSLFFSKANSCGMVFSKLCDFILSPEVSIEIRNSIIDFLNDELRKNQQISRQQTKGSASGKMRAEKTCSEMISNVLISEVYDLVVFCLIENVIFYMKRDGREESAKILRSGMDLFRRVIDNPSLFREVFSNPKKNDVSTLSNFLRYYLLFYFEISSLVQVNMVCDAEFKEYRLTTELGSLTDREDSYFANSFIYNWSYKVIENTSRVKSELRRYVEFHDNKMNEKIESATDEFGMQYTGNMDLREECILGYKQGLVSIRIEKQEKQKKWLENFNLVIDSCDYFCLHALPNFYKKKRSSSDFGLLICLTKCLIDRDLTKLDSETFFEKLKGLAGNDRVSQIDANYDQELDLELVTCLRSCSSAAEYRKLGIQIIDTYGKKRTAAILEDDFWEEEIKGSSKKIPAPRPAKHKKSPPSARAAQTQNASPPCARAAQTQNASPPVIPTKAAQSKNDSPPVTPAKSIVVKSHFSLASKKWDSPTEKGWKEVEASSPVKKKSFLRALMNSSESFEVASHVRRWSDSKGNTDAIRAFSDSERDGEIILKYSSKSDPEIQSQYAFHFLPEASFIFKKLFFDHYTKVEFPFCPIPNAKNYGILAQLTIPDLGVRETSLISVTLKDNLVCHWFFLPLTDVRVKDFMKNNGDLITRLNKADITVESANETWEGDEGIVEEISPEGFRPLLRVTSKTSPNHQLILFPKTLSK